MWVGCCGAVLGISAAPSAEEPLPVGSSFRDKGRVSHPQKQSPKGEDDSRVPTYTKENESYGTTEKRWSRTVLPQTKKGQCAPGKRQRARGWEEGLAAV